MQIIKDCNILFEKNEIPISDLYPIKSHLIMIITDHVTCITTDNVDCNFLTLNIDHYFTIYSCYFIINILTFLTFFGFEKLKNPSENRDYPTNECIFKIS